MTDIRVDLATPSVEVDTSTTTVGIGVPGPTGPQGPPGIIRVDHGADNSVPRPDSALVLWVGAVEPTHADKAVDLIVWTA